MGKKISVKVEGKTFNSLKDACTYLKINNVAGIANAIKAGNNKYKGLNIEVLSNPNTKDNKRSCPVICETTGKKFKTITEAAKVANVDSWTMSKKMSTSGSFKDKDGNIYIRIKPMITKNEYTNTGNELKRQVPFHKRNNKTISISVPEVESPVVKFKKDILSIAKDKVCNYIKNNEFDLAKDMIDYLKKIS